MDELLILIGFIFTILLATFIAIDTKKRDMSQAWALICIIGLLGLVIYLIARKPISVNKVQNIPILPNQNISQEIIIPDTCPNCKNPNTKKIRLCEWCGNQIV